MSKSTGVHTRIGTVFPGLGRVQASVSLSKEAKIRLSWIDFYVRHGKNSSLTCRHFGIARSCFYKWLNRFNSHGLRSLESVSTRPSNVRQSLVPNEVVAVVKDLRRTNPEYSKYKLSVILKRDYGYSLSSSTIGRIITQHNLFFTPLVKPKNHPHRLKNLRKLRKPPGFKATKPGRLIEVDVKHLPSVGTKRYGFVAIDVVSKQVAIHVSSTISSTQGALAWKKAVHRLGLPDAVLTDNGSENMGAFTALLETQSTEHFWARPRTPKDKPHVERFIGTLERECIQWGGLATDTKDQQDIINTWLDKYHNYRPHQSLGYLTPNEYKSKLDAEVSSMY
jgi:transposase InsO family protein